MYHVYKKEKGLFQAKTILGDYKDYDKASERVAKELAKDSEFKYTIEQTTGHVDNYGELVSDILEEN